MFTTNIDISNNLIKEANKALEEREYYKAKLFCEEASRFNPQNPISYLIQILIEYKVTEIEELKNCNFDFNSEYYRRLRLYADEELNRVCGLFGKGKNADSARSINVDDINKITGYNPNAVGIKNPTEEEIANGKKYGQGDYPYQYGRKVTYSWDGNTDKKPVYTYPGKENPVKIGAHNTFSWFDGKSWNISNYEAGKTGKICTLTSNYYLYYPTTLTASSSGDVSGISTDSDEYKLLFDITNFGNGEKEYYWIASKCVYAYSYSVAFVERCVLNGYVDFVNLAYANSSERGNIFTNGLGLRPIVYLKSDIRLKKDENGVWQFIDD